MVYCQICGQPIENHRYIRIGADGEGVHSGCLERYLGKLPTPGPSTFDLPQLLFQLLEDEYTDDVPFNYEEVIPLGPGEDY